MELEEAIRLLKNIVKESHIPGQMHVDMSLAPAQEWPLYEEALQVVVNAVAENKLDAAEAKRELGLNL